MNHTSPALPIDELVVNWHLTEACNYKCDYCYASWTKPSESKAIWRNPELTLSLLKAVREYFDSANNANPLYPNLRWKNIRLSLAGGEPILLGSKFKDIVMAATGLGFKVSVITNASFITDELLNWLSPRLSILGISVDSNSASLNRLIGRLDNKGNMLNAIDLKRITAKAKSLNPDLKIKLNTVVNKHNWAHDMSNLIQNIQPDKWKALRVLPSVSPKLCITNEQFQYFIAQHSILNNLMSVEDNEHMHDSYIMIDPLGRFFQNSLIEQNSFGYVYSDPILNAGIDNAFNQINFSTDKFYTRYESTGSVKTTV